MDQDVQYYPDVPERLIAFFRGTFKDYFKAYFDGDPVDIPQSYLPCLIVENMTSSHRVHAAPIDKQDSVIMIKVVLNKKDDFGASPDVDMTKKKLRRIVAGRDALTGAYVPNSIMGLLRTQITLGGVTISNEEDVQYEPDVRPSSSDDPIVTSEAWITVSARELVGVGPAPNVSSTRN